MARLADGYKIGNCVIEEHLGAGLSGEVYKARYKDKIVALKVFSQEREQDSTVQGYLLNEHMLLREVTAHRHHENIVEYVNSRESSPPMYLMTCYIDGAQALEKLIHQSFTAGFVLHVVEKLASALDYLHYGHPTYRPIIHRDVKPHNVLIGADNRVVLIDLSIARSPNFGLEKERGLGTVQYMPPEQYEGREVPATDQFALAVMTLHMLTGQELLPREKHKARDKLFDLRNSDYAEVRELMGQRTHTAEALIKALQYAPGERYASCEEFAFHLRQGLAADGEALDHFRSPVQPPRVYIEYIVIAVVAILAIALLASYFRWLPLP
jgi:eukaryotic-like serine/threonine-protein kinase